MKNLFITLTLLLITLIFTNCKKDTKEPEPIVINNPAPTPSYTIPTSYNFANASFTSSTQRLEMMGELINLIKSTHTTTSPTQPTISAAVLQNMFVNSASPFSTSSLNINGLQIKDQTSNSFMFVTETEANFIEAQAASITSAANPTTSTASSGTKGKLVSPARAVLVNANGYEYKEVVEKGLMGACIFNQAMSRINNIASYDNSTITNSITAQEKAWDEAFGYFGVPLSFPTSTINLKYWGNYCNAVNVAIGSNSTIMNAFLKGRAAISNKDNTARDEAKAIVVSTWEKVGAAKCISYLKAAKNNLSDQATLHHVLSEGHGFVLAFKYNTAKTISDADINLLLSYFGNNLYNITTTNIDLAIAKLESVFSLNASLIP
ncbi:MAG: DUF4856 domain-containing protein [Sphingobacteriaceae bacterium]|nr:DUF4856 domain-containing protein [Sphingobacteriaceae bacterium]